MKHATRTIGRTLQYNGDKIEKYWIQFIFIEANHIKLAVYVRMFEYQLSSLLPFDPYFTGRQTVYRDEV